MRHGKSINHLGRTSSHRHALLKNLASSLILHKRITTTVAKAKELRKYVEPILNRTKNDSTHNRRIAFSYLQNKETVKELFDVVADKIAARPGGYTRIIKLGARLGDNAETCIIELVDFNETTAAAAEAASAKKGRSRRGKKSSGVAAAPAAAAAVSDTAVEDAQIVEDAPVAEATTEEVAPEATSEGDAPEATTDEETKPEA